MIPVGYMAKRIELKPEWLKTEKVKDIYSLSGCTSRDFADYFEFWKHNGYWLFNTAEDIYSLAKENNIDMTNTTLFFYEVYEYQCYEDNPEWEPFEPDKAFNTKVKAPKEKTLEGYDVVSFYCENAPECSYLSCNHMAEHLKVNEHCLFDSFEDAKAHLDNKVFDGCEPGPCRIFAVYTVQNA